MKFSAYLLTLFVGLFMLSGCKAPVPSEVRKTGAVLLSEVLQEVDSATAKKDAQFISTAMSTDIIPFVTDSKLPAAQLIPQLRKLLGAKIANQKYVGAALSIITMATSFGNIDIKAPAMSDLERQYVLAACGAIQDACNAYLSGKSVQVKIFEPEGVKNADAKIPEPESKRAEVVEPELTADGRQIAGHTVEKGHYLLNGIDYYEVDGGDLATCDAVVDGRPCYAIGSAREPIVRRAGDSRSGQ